MKTKVNIEVQLRSQAYFDNRILFSWSRVFTEGHKQGQGYGDLPKVIAINIMDFDFPPNESYHEYYQLRGRYNPLRIMSGTQEIHCIDMTKWRKLPKIDIVNDDLHRWLAWFDQHSPPELLKEVIAMDDAIKAADERQSHVTLDDEARSLYLKRQMALMDQIGYTRRFEELEELEDIQRKSREIGLEEGREIGLEIGRNEGLEEGQETARLNIARNALAEGATIEFVHKITGLDRETIERLGN